MDQSCVFHALKRVKNPQFHTFQEIILLARAELSTFVKKNTNNVFKRT